jgi:cell division protein YceG involved in septum cleavage
VLTDKEIEDIAQESTKWLANNQITSYLDNLQGMDMRLHKGLEKRILDGLEDFSKYYVLNNQSKELIEGHFNLTSSMRAVNILNQHELNNGRSPKYKTVEFIPGKEIKKRLMNLEV